MNALLILIPIALFLGLLGLAAFLWAMRSGQFDDLEGAGQRILFDDRPRRAAVQRDGADVIPQAELISRKGNRKWIRH